jgi:hypothetical protein
VTSAANLSSTSCLVGLRRKCLVAVTVESVFTCTHDRIPSCTFRSSRTIGSRSTMSCSVTPPVQFPFPESSRQPPAYLAVILPTSKSMAKARHVHQLKLTRYNILISGRLLAKAKKACSLTPSLYFSTNQDVARKSFLPEPIPQSERERRGVWQRVATRWKMYSPKLLLLRNAGSDSIC